jgi:TetR/AcrR family transcriptional repressor of nem operon
MPARNSPLTATPPPTRSAIVDAADALFYQRGYAHTSFADIAGAVGISRGNFYYHFRTKDEILDAVIAARVERTRTMLVQWGDGAESPLERIRAFVHIVLRNQADIERYGCPVGTLTAEMAKLGHPARAEAATLFALFRDWLRGQFEAMGAGSDADALALHVLIWSQGVATLANALGDAGFLTTEVARMGRWLDEQAKRLTPPRALPRPRSRTRSTPRRGHA